MVEILVNGWLPYVAAFGLALASTVAGYFVGFRIVMSVPGFGYAGFFGVVVLIPLSVGLGVFVVSYAAFTDRWLGVQNTLTAAAFVYFVGFLCFLLLMQDLLGHLLVGIMMVVTLFFGGRLLLKRADLA